MSTISVQVQYGGVEDDIIPGKKHTITAAFKWLRRPRIRHRIRPTCKKENEEKKNTKSSVSRLGSPPATDIFVGTVVFMIVFSEISRRVITCALVRARIAAETIKFRYSVRGVRVHARWIYAYVNSLKPPRQGK